MEMIQSVAALRPQTTDKHDLSRPILELKDVSVRFNNTMALDSVSFGLQPGERVAVIGPNGGKAPYLMLLPVFYPLRRDG